MPRQPRSVAESGFYHVIQRGAGKQLIFEDDSDRATLLETVGTHLSNRDMSLLAYCLMDNHVHLLVEDPAGNLSEAFHSAWTTYARRFNTKTGRIGPVFQGRFKSVPIESDPQLLLTARYIHENPKRAGLCPTDTYPWSSYHSYLHDDASGLVNTAVLLDMLGGRTGFERFHQEPEGKREPFYPFAGGRVPDTEAFQAARCALHPTKVHELKGLPKMNRNACLVRLRKAGLTVLQIERLTGIGRNTISRVTR